MFRPFKGGGFISQGSTLPVNSSSWPGEQCSTRGMACSRTWDLSGPLPTLARSCIGMLWCEDAMTLDIWRHLETVGSSM